MQDFAELVPTFLLQKAVHNIGVGLLPAISQTRVWAGRGSGECCDLCGRVIRITEVEIELDAEDGARIPRFHSACHSLWQQACRQAVG
jgi:hypothetical protein